MEILRSFAFIISSILYLTFCQAYCRSNNDCKWEKEKQICGQQGKDTNVAINTIVVFCHV
jgi:hypothetical protein